MKVRIVSDKKTGKAARLTTLSNNWTIETWWDKHYRNFLTQIKDSKGLCCLLKRSAEVMNWESIPAAA